MSLRDSSLDHGGRVTSEPEPCERGCRRVASHHETEAQHGAAPLSSEACRSAALTCSVASVESTLIVQSSQALRGLSTEPGWACGVCHFLIQHLAASSESCFVAGRVI